MAKPTDEELKAQQEAVARKAAEEAELARMQAEEDAKKAAEAAAAAKAEEEKKAAEAAAKLAPVKLLRDFWPEEDKRVQSGEVIELPAATARLLIEAGVAERADPLPGE